MVVRIAGKRMYLWRAVDHEGEVLDMLVQRRRDSRAALRLMRKLEDGHEVTRARASAGSFAVGVPGLAGAADDWQAQVGAALGKTGATAPGGIYRVGLPRTDLKVTLDGVELKAGFALGSWLASEKMGDQGMVMGDLVLTMEEVAPVMTKLAADGIEVTALHNHLLSNPSPEAGGRGH